MSTDAEPVSFRTRRSSGAALQAVEAPQAVEAEIPPETEVGTRILVISSNNGLGQMIGAALGSEASTSVDYSQNSLADLKTESTSLMDGYNVVVFEAHPGNDMEMHVLRKLTAARPPETKFLAMTAGELTLAYAKDLMDAGVEEVLPLSAIRPDLKDSVALEPHIEHAITRRGSEDRNGAIVAVAQTRGGIGATSTALSLGFELSRPPKAKRKVDVPPAKRVAVVDFDIQNGNLGAYVDVEDNGRTIEMLRNGALPNGDDLKAIMRPYSYTLHILPAPTEFAPIEALTPELVATLLDELRYAYDVVIVDLPRVIVEWLAPLLARADQMLIITDTAVPSVRQARRLVDFYSEDHVSLPIEIVISQEKAKFSLTDAQKEASAILERGFNHWLPRDDTSARKANDGGKPLTEIAPKSPLGKAQTKLSALIDQVHSSEVRRRA